MTTRVIVLIAIQWLAWIGAIATGYFLGRARGLREAREIFAKLVRDENEI